MNEPDFLMLLKMMVSNEQIGLEMLNQQLVARYETADKERRAQLKAAVRREMRLAESLAQNLAAFNSVDQKQTGA